MTDTPMSPEERGSDIAHKASVLIGSHTMRLDLRNFARDHIRQAELAARHQGVEQAREEFNEIIERERRIAGKAALERELEITKASLADQKAENARLREALWFYNKATLGPLLADLGETAREALTASGDPSAAAE